MFDKEKSVTELDVIRSGNYQWYTARAPNLVDFIDRLALDYTLQGLYFQKSYFPEKFRMQ